MVICCLLHSAIPRNIIAQHSSCSHEPYVWCIGSSPQCLNQCQCQCCVFLSVSLALSGVLPVSAVHALESRPPLQLLSHFHHLNVRKQMLIMILSHCSLPHRTQHINYSTCPFTKCEFRQIHSPNIIQTHTMCSASPSQTFQYFWNEKSVKVQQITVCVCVYQLDYQKLYSQQS